MLLLADNACLLDSWLVWSDVTLLLLQVKARTLAGTMVCGGAKFQSVVLSEIVLSVYSLYWSFIVVYRSTYYTVPYLIIPRSHQLFI